MTLTIGSLFSGIGGLELGLERAGLGPTLWQCEIDPFCRRVLAKHWPNVTRYTDVSQPRSYASVDLICGGFPCQDVSAAGKGAGINGARSGLWWHFANVVSLVRPRFVVVENVASGARRWLPTVRRHLQLLGYDSVAYAVSAADVGAPHLRRRIFIVATNTERVRVRIESGRVHGPRGKGTSQLAIDGDAGAVAHARFTRLEGEDERRAPIDVAARRGGVVAHADSEGELCTATPGLEGRNGAEHRGQRSGSADGWWAVEPELGRVAHGIPDRLERLKALGNAVVPQCAEAVGRVIVAKLEAGTRRQKTNAAHP